MDLEEAKKLARIAGTADGGCSVCVSGIVGHLNAAFPAFRWTATNEDAPKEQPDWSDDPEDAESPGLLVLVEPA